MSPSRSIARPVIGLVAVLGAAVVATMVLAVSAAPALASGTYGGRPASPPASVDRASYELGKKVYAGQFARSANAAATAAQRAALTELQERLPIRARNDVDLPSYAGQLDDAQYEALLYFLKKRFKVE